VSVPVLPPGLDVTPAQGGLRDQKRADELSLREILVEDFETYGRRLVEPGFWAVALHRVGARLDGIEPAVLRRPLETTHKLLSTAVDWVWGINLPKTTRLGRRVRIWHNGSIVLNARAIGNDVQLRHDTTLGSVRMKDRDRPEFLPVIGDGADIGSGACILGDVTLGKGALVGANSVVLRSVPPGATVFGVPAKVMPT
jgi:serine O-acetyltransferase